MLNQDFLDNFPNPRRGVVKTVFLSVSDRHNNRPLKIYPDHPEWTIPAEMHPYYGTSIGVAWEVLWLNQDREDRQDICEQIRRNKKQAVEFAELTLAWHTMPDAAKKAFQRKADEANGPNEHQKFHMAGKSTTDKQAEVITRAGRAVPLDRYEASLIIAELMGNHE